MRRALVWSGLAVLLWGCGSESTPSATVGTVEPQDAESVQDAQGEISLADPGPEETTVEPDADIQEAEVAPTQDVTEEVLELPVEPDVVEPEPDLFAQGHKPQFAIQIPPALLESLEESWEESVETTVTIDGETLAGVGLTLVKFDKNVPSIAGKPRIHLQFDAVDPAQRFQGYRGLWLHELSKDGSKVAEVLGYSLFQASELPAPRAAHAWVQINEEDRGLYVALEPYGDPVFVQRYAESLDAPVYSAPSKLDLVHDQLESFQLEHGVDEERAQLQEMFEERFGDEGAWFFGEDGTARGFRFFHDGERGPFSLEDGEIPEGLQQMLDNLGLLAKRHVVVFVALRDPELERLEERDPGRLVEVGRAVVAADLVRERQLVLQKLRQAGVHLVDAPPGELADRLLERYFQIKRRELV